ncbi:P-loop containing nucleoside triphosphate hydrolase protein [Lentithecium fluviatile CBS 122367]|uniref:P-loop containing nucleoside triphosphate hydrolase protein n=1 Tax=Lentithecium fluviatile CBS 122367 TaxID=1168545 RepID=A0A6G1IIG3_9PLEO|nr:P-loop containing nucleoside triphosphate hydrolase protein [Lentithecium fluviatile CBS 122367]
MGREGAISPAALTTSTWMTATRKRKERDFESDAAGGANFINVVVRCRGRNEQEMSENSNVVVTTEGIKGKQVDVSMGLNSLSNKTCNFDRVFSPAADQSMVFNDVVRPMLDELDTTAPSLHTDRRELGKRAPCPDMTNTLGILSDAAGIIPRVLQGLFNELQMRSTEHCVKVSFLELYNEELRDLIAVDTTTKLKVYDNITRKGHATTIVQGMDEKHIKDATEGIKVLQEGSTMRRVAATKYNDLSSRSHTIFTIMVYLSLVGLAGTENIQRSDAENKRAAEAPLAELKENITNSALREYELPCDTPQPNRYQFPTQLPRTEPGNMLVADMHYISSPRKPAGSLSIFTDTLENAEPIPSPLRFSASLGPVTFASDPTTRTTSLSAENMNMPTLKMRRIRTERKEVEVEAEEKENVVPNFSANRLPSGKGTASGRIHELIFPSSGPCKKWLPSLKVTPLSLLDPLPMRRSYSGVWKIAVDSEPRSRPIRVARGPNGSYIHDARLAKRFFKEAGRRIQTAQGDDLY